jgi:hypothetical protein
MKGLNVKTLHPYTRETSKKGMGSNWVHEQAASVSDAHRWSLRETQYICVKVAVC